MDNFDFSHVILLLTTCIHHLISIFRGSDNKEFLIDEVISTFNYISSYLNNFRNS